MKEPWELYPEIWKTEASFFTYLRGHLRQIWSRYPAKLKWKGEQAIKPPLEYTGRAKKLCKCYYCQELFPISSTEVDHSEMAGQCNSWETAYQFLYKLLDCKTEWRITCKPCHKIKSYAERTGLSFEDARAAKAAIEFVKKDKKLVLAFLEANGYNGDSVSSAPKRKKLVDKLFKEGKIC